MDRKEEKRRPKPLTQRDSTLREVPAGDLPKDPALSVLESFQQKHDLAFHKDVMSWPMEKQLEHCQMHLAKLSGLLATICEKKHHGEATDELEFVEDRIADLLVFALKLANLYKIDLAEVYQRRMEQVEREKLS